MKITNVKGTAVPKTANDQNTDDIVPARYLKEITFSRMGEYAYFDERAKEGEKHPFNNPRYQDANILIAGANYGCGSSREHAPQALKRFGIDAIIAESFAEIFAGNCASLGVVGVTVPVEVVTFLAKHVLRSPATLFDIDLERKLIEYKNGCKEGTVMFDIPEGRRKAFLDGTWDAMTVLQRDQEGIQRVEKSLEYLKF